MCEKKKKTTHHLLRDWPRHELQAVEPRGQKTGSEAREDEVLHIELSAAGETASLLHLQVFLLPKIIIIFIFGERRRRYFFLKQEQA